MQAFLFCFSQVPLRHLWSVSPEEYRCSEKWSTQAASHRSMTDEPVLMGNSVQYQSPGNTDKG